MIEKKTLIRPLHEKEHRTDFNNCRGISLLPVTYKSRPRYLLDRAQHQNKKLVNTRLVSDQTDPVRGKL